MKLIKKNIIVAAFLGLFLLKSSIVNGGCCWGGSIDTLEYEIIESPEYQLLTACRNGDSKKAECLLMDPKVEVDINARDDQGNTILMLLLDYRNTNGWFKTTLKSTRGRLITRLLSSGIDMSVQNNAGETALMKAVYEPEIYVLPKLLEYSVPPVLNVQDAHGMTALMHTVVSGIKSVAFKKQRECKHVAKLLVDARADIMLRNNEGKTVLDIIGRDYYFQPLKQYMRVQVLRGNELLNNSL